jgi:hypothetical protein
MNEIHADWPVGRPTITFPIKSWKLVRIARGQPQIFSGVAVRHEFPPTQRDRDVPSYAALLAADHLFAVAFHCWMSRRGTAWDSWEARGQKSGRNNPLGLEILETWGEPIDRSRSSSREKQRDRLT